MTSKIVASIFSSETQKNFLRNVQREEDVTWVLVEAINVGFSSSVKTGADQILLCIWGNLGYEDKTGRRVNAFLWIFSLIVASSHC